MRFDSKPDSQRESGRPEMKGQPSHLDFRIRRTSSRASIQKLVLLVLLLFGVVYTMIEAGKPERWHWLIPPPENEVGLIPIEAFDRNQQDQLDTPEVVHHAAELKFAQIDTTTYPAAANRFWSTIMRRLTTAQRNSLFLLLKRIRHQQTFSSGQKTELKSFLDIINIQRTKFHLELMNELTYSTDGTEKKAARANELFESESVWDRAEWPALSNYMAGNELSTEQQMSLLQLQAVLDPLALSFVVDRTAQGWEGDSPAWGRIWEQLVHQDLSAPMSVTHLELSAQPETYRGQAVQIRGGVLGAWREAMPIKELGIEHLFVLIVRPEDSKVTPFYVYVRELPTGFPRVLDRYTSLNQRIVAEGIFFKIRTYRDTEEQIQQSPMILAKTVLPVAKEAGLPTSSVTLLDKPMLIFCGLIVMPLIAIGIAWFAYQTNRTIRFKPGPNRTREIQQDLRGLAEDPEIKSAEQRIRDLYE